MHVHPWPALGPLGVERGVAGLVPIAGRLALPVVVLGALAVPLVPVPVEGVARPRRGSDGRHGRAVGGLDRGRAAGAGLLVEGDRVLVALPLGVEGGGGGLVPAAKPLGVVRVVLGATGLSVEPARERVANPRGLGGGYRGHDCAVSGRHLSRLAARAPVGVERHRVGVGRPPRVEGRRGRLVPGPRRLAVCGVVLGAPRAGGGVVPAAERVAGLRGLGGRDRRHGGAVGGRDVLGLAAGAAVGVELDRVGVGLPYGVELKPRRIGRPGVLERRRGGGRGDPSRERVAVLGAVEAVVPGAMGAHARRLVDDQARAALPDVSVLEGQRRRRLRPDVRPAGHRGAAVGRPHVARVLERVAVGMQGDRRHPLGAEV